MPDPTNAGVKPDHCPANPGDRLKAFQGSGEAAYSAASIETGYKYLSAIENGEIEQIDQNQRVCFERF